jgi:hypothetical protein
MELRTWKKDSLKRMGKIFAKYIAIKGIMSRI